MTLKSLKTVVVALALVGGASMLTGAAIAQQPRSALSNLGQTLQPLQSPTPAESAQIQLVSETIDIFLEAVKARSMKGVHDHASLLVKREFTVEKLNEAFVQFFQIPVTGKPLASLVPIFTQPATQAGPNAFRIVGYFATQPSNVTFDITYVREGTGWKWAALNVRIAPPGQPAS